MKIDWFVPSVTTFFECPFRSPFSPIFCPQAAAAAGPHFRGYWGNGQAAAVADSGALHMVPTVQVDPNVAPPPPQLPEPFR